MYVTEHGLQSCQNSLWLIRTVTPPNECKKQCVTTAINYVVYYSKYQCPNLTKTNSQNPRTVELSRNTIQYKIKDHSGFLANMELIWVRWSEIHLGISYRG